MLYSTWHLVNKYLYKDLTKRLNIYYTRLPTTLLRIEHNTEELQINTIKYIIYLYIMYLIEMIDIIHCLGVPINHALPTEV